MPVSSFSYDFTAAPALSQVRLLVADTDSAKPVFSDAEITQILDLESSNVYLAAATLLNSLAANRARLASVVQLLDVKLSPEVAAKELRALAKEYRETAETSGGFAIAEMVGTIFAARERIWNQALRT